MLQITTAQNKEYMAYAKRRSPDYGEDAYQDAMVSILQHPNEMHNQDAYIKQAIKYKILKNYVHQQAQRQVVEAYLSDIIPPQLASLKAGRVVRALTKHQPRKKRTHCLKGHLFTTENQVYVKGNRTCKACAKLRRAVYLAKRARR